MIKEWFKNLCCFIINKNKNTNKVVSDIKEVDIVEIALLEKATPFVPPISSGVVTNVYDGDTFTLVSKLPYKGSPLYKFKVRISGINCPEIRGKTQQEKDAAQAAKKEVMELILYKQVELTNVGLEKYGRLLADVYIINDDNKINIGQHLLNKGLAKVYNGSCKDKEPFNNY